MSARRVQAHQRRRTTKVPGTVITDRLVSVCATLEYLGVRASPVHKVRRTRSPGVAVVMGARHIRYYTLPRALLADPMDAFDWAVLISTDVRGVQA